MRIVVEKPQDRWFGAAWSKAEKAAESGVDLAEDELTMVARLELRYTEVDGSAPQIHQFDVDLTTYRSPYQRPDPHFTVVRGRQ